MKNVIKNQFGKIAFVLVLGTLYFVLGTTHALCTLSPDNAQCYEGQSCTLPAGCDCFSNVIAINETCLGSHITVDNSGVPATAISGSLITFNFTVTSYTGDKYFVLHLPWTTDYGIQYINSSIVPENIATLSTTIGGVDPYFIIHQGETKNIVITGKVITNNYRSFASMRATGMIYLDPLFQQTSTFTGMLSSVINPIADLVVSKVITGTLPIFSGDSMHYIVYIKNIGSATSFGYTFFDKMPYVLRSPVAKFNGTIHHNGGYVTTSNTYLWSGSYLDIDPGQTIVVEIEGILSGGISAGASLDNNAGITDTYPGNEYSVEGNIVTVTGNVPSYVDIYASTVSTGGTDPQLSGDVVTFTFEYGQLGNMTATGVTMTVGIDNTNISGTVFNLPDLPAGATGSLIVTGVLNGNYPAGTSICGIVTIASPSENIVIHKNNRKGICTVVAPTADVTITKAVASSINLESVLSGGAFAYVITVTNTGSKAATGIVVTDTLPSQFSYVSNNYATPTIVANTLIRNIATLNAGASVNIILTGTLNTYPNSGMLLINTGSVTTASREISASNNQTVFTTVLSGIADLYITKTSSAISGYKAGTPIIYTINYGNAGGRTASGVVITDTFPSTLLSTPTTSWTIGQVLPGQTGSITVVGTIIADLPAGQVISNSASITTVTPQLSTTNDSATITGVIPTVAGLSIDMIANNLTRPQLDNPPYGTNPNTMIQAVSGDVIQFTFYYGSNGNVSANNASISLGGIAGVAIIQGSHNVALGTLTPGQTGVVIMTGIVGVQNFVTFSPVATLAYNTDQAITDTLVVNEPFACGDGLITRTEQCDTNGQLGNIAPGQECENQQGACTLVTKFIVNNACVSFDFNNPTSGYGTGQSCSSAALSVTQASCAGLTVGASTAASNGTTDVALTCNGKSSSNSTRISINCGNGSFLSGFGSSLAGTCNYAAGFNGNASCLVGGEVSPAVGCTQSVGVNGGQCRVMTLDGDMIIVDENGDGTMPVVCQAGGNDMSNPEVSCGADGQYRNGVCIYDGVDESDFGETRTITCRGSAGVSCSKDLIVDEGFLADCGNGHREGYEACDGNDMPQRYKDKGYSCSSRCTIEENDYYPPACLTVNNGNISVQEGEWMPFRWKLDAKRLTTRTSEPCTPGQVNKDTMSCTFAITNGKGKHTLSDTYDCKENKRQGILFDYFKTNPNFSSESSAFGKYAFKVDSAFTNGVYGEFKLSLEKVSYEYCDANGSRRDSREEVDRICEVNFAVTRPYLAQRSTFGLTPKATDIDLDGFKTINGVSLITDTQLDKIMTVDANDYEGGRKINTMTDAFIKKQEKLAIKIDKSKLSNLDGLDAVTTIKKVPNQNIFIFAGTKGSITLTKGFDAPFTLITKGLDVHIKGDLATNGMFLVDGGDIYFDEPDNACLKTQEVKGIFVVNDGKFTSKKLANTLTSNPRCNYGGLYVKGVLIGDGIDTLVKNRRSQLNSRFYLSSENENAQKTQRRNKIFNGAAVLIEYSPSLWTALPPGANEFTKALEVYKK